MSAVSINGRLDLVSYPQNNVQSETEKDLSEEEYVILMEAAKALGIKDEVRSHFPARQKLQLGSALVGGALTGGAIGGAIGIVGGPKGICIGIGVGMIVGAVGAVIVYKRINPGNYEKWRDKQTKDTMLEFAKVFQGEQFKVFVCKGTNKIMSRPAIGTCGHKFDFEYFTKHVKDTMHYDPVVDKEVGFCPSSNDNTCILEENDIRVDYDTMARLIRVYKDCINNKMPHAASLTPLQIQGIRQLHEDLSVLMHYCYKAERDHNNALADADKLDPLEADARNFKLSMVCRGVVGAKSKV